MILFCFFTHYSPPILAQGSVPQLGKRIAHIAQNLVSLKTKLDKAICYTLNQWGTLIRYINDGWLSIDNNRAERAVNPFVIGQKNWLFSASTQGAQSSEMLDSIIETTKANGLISYDYSSGCLQSLCTNPNDIEPILPWNIKLNL